MAACRAYGGASRFHCCWGCAPERQGTLARALLLPMAHAGSERWAGPTCPPLPASAGDHPVQSRAGPPLRVPDITPEESRQYLEALGVAPVMAEKASRHPGTGASHVACSQVQAACLGRPKRQMPGMHLCPGLLPSTSLLRDSPPPATPLLQCCKLVGGSLLLLQRCAALAKAGLPFTGGPPPATQHGPRATCVPLSLLHRLQGGRAGARLRCLWLAD